MATSLAASRTFANAAPQPRSFAGAAVSKIAVFSDPAAARAPWNELEAVAPASAYQTQAWLLPWYDTIGKSMNVRPLVSVAYDAAGAALGLLPLGIMNRGPLHLVEFPGGKDANFTFGLFLPGMTFTKTDLSNWLKETARQAEERIDLFALVNQPESWNGAVNPLRALGGQASPAEGYRTALASGPEAFLKSRLSGETRKKMRAKERKLGELGKLRYFTARDAGEARAILRAFAEQKAQRLKDMGVKNTFAEPAAEAFLERAALDFAACGKGGVELHALAVNDRIAATFGGATHQGRFSGMFNSFDLDPQLTRTSPGELLLNWLIQEKCRAGLHTFDLGVGAARYKETWCDTLEPLFDLYAPVNLLGYGLFKVKSAKRRLKHGIKNSPLAWRAVETLRKLRR